MDPKKLAAERAVDYIKSGMVIGLGTGSTAYWAIQAIGNMVQQGLQISAVPTSIATEKLALTLNIPLLSGAEMHQIDLAIDGADAIDVQNNLIKGGGGALLREKIVAYNSRQFIVVADESKMTDNLGTVPLPVEVLPYGVLLALNQIAKLCSKAVIRTAGEKAFVTDNGNLIIDCHFDFIKDPQRLELQLKAIPGVLETGIFLSTKVHTVVIGYQSGRVEEFNKNRQP